MTTTQTPNLALPLQALLSKLSMDVLTDANGLLSTALKNIKANPTPQNVAAQGAVVAASAMFSLPTLEQQTITDATNTAQQLLTLANSFATQKLGG